jgi:hypothetical protein
MLYIFSDKEAQMPEKVILVKVRDLTEGMKVRRDGRKRTITSIMSIATGERVIAFGSYRDSTILGLDDELPVVDTPPKKALTKKSLTPKVRVRYSKEGMLLVDENDTEHLVRLVSLTAERAAWRYLGHEVIFTRNEQGYLTRTGSVRMPRELYALLEWFSSHTMQAVFAGFAEANQRREVKRMQKSKPVTLAPQGKLQF